MISLSERREGESSYREKETRTLRHEDHAESSRETWECTEHHIHTPGLNLHVSKATTDGVSETTDYSPGQESSEDGANRPKASYNDDKRSTITTREELTVIGEYNREGSSDAGRGERVSEHY